jgi:hypothetical protein
VSADDVPPEARTCWTCGRFRTVEGRPDCDQSGEFLRFADRWLIYVERDLCQMPTRTSGPCPVWHDPRPVPS